MAREHLFDLDSLHEYEWSKEDEDAFRQMFHEELMRENRCHIWNGRTFCFCRNGHETDKEA